MTITTLDGLVDALANTSSRIVIDKASISNTAVGQFHSLWRATGQPGQGAVPTTVANCTDDFVGAMRFAQQTAPATTYAAYLEAACSSNSVTLELHDRLMHRGGLAGNINTLQTATVDLFAQLANDNLDARKGDANFSDVQWWLEWYTDTGPTATVATVNVTYDDATTGNLTGISLAATRRPSLMQSLNGFIPAAKSGLYIQAVNSVQLSVSTGTLGNFGVTATRLRASLGCPLANQKWSADWAALPLSEVANTACLFIVIMPGTTSTGTIRGGGKLAHG
jgi:hypothetical protein